MSPTIVGKVFEIFNTLLPQFLNNSLKHTTGASFPIHSYETTCNTVPASFKGQQKEPFKVTKIQMLLQ
jgi:hypothetical protein